VEENNFRLGTQKLGTYRLLVIRKSSTLVPLRI